MISFIFVVSYPQMEMERQVAKIEQSRRAVLQKSVGMIAGGIGVVGSIGTASAALPYTVTLNGGGDLSYRIRVNGSISPGRGIDSSDESDASSCKGFIANSYDQWRFSGDVTGISLTGRGECVFKINAGRDPSYPVDIYTGGNDIVSYLWEQDGNITGGDGSLEPNDHINGSIVGGRISSGIDEFNVSGHPERIQVEDGPRETFHWRAFGL